MSSPLPPHWTIGVCRLGNPDRPRHDTPVSMQTETSVSPDGSRWVHTFDNHYSTAAEALESMWRRRVDAGRRPRRVPGGLTWTEPRTGDVVTIIYADYEETTQPPVSVALSTEEPQ